MSQTREEPKPKSFHAPPPDFLSKNLSSIIGVILLQFVFLWFGFLKDIWHTTLIWHSNNNFDSLETGSIKS